MGKSMSKSLSGKVALVTGGLRGIGAATARALAEQGADVAISYAVATAKAEALVSELEQFGVRAMALKVDAADSYQVETLVKQVHGHFGRLDILINTTGAFVSPTSLEADESRHQQAVNVDGVVAAVNAAAPLLPEGGRIVNVAATSSPQRNATLAEYYTKKSALTAYTKHWARNLGPRRITVNSVQPGPIDTELNPDHTELAETLRESTALHRYGRAHEVAAAITFLASPAASYITGTTLNVDGGQE
jgi:3-oxoacyl-[acyl-carrier protein] reductase